MLNNDVITCRSFWTEDALRWLQSILHLSAQFDAPTPPRGLTGAAADWLASTPAEVQEYVRRLIMRVRCALVRGAGDVALESSEALLEMWRKHRPHVARSWRGSQPHLVVEIAVLRSRALMLAGQPEQALDFLEKDTISELLGAHVQSALSAEYCPGQQKEFAHLYVTARKAPSLPRICSRTLMGLLRSPLLRFRGRGRTTQPRAVTSWRGSLLLSALCFC